MLRAHQNFEKHPLGHDDGQHYWMHSWPIGLDLGKCFLGKFIGKRVVATKTAQVKSKSRLVAMDEQREGFAVRLKSRHADEVFIRRRRRACHALNFEYCIRLRFFRLNFPYDQKSKADDEGDSTNAPPQHLRRVGGKQESHQTKAN